MIVVDTSVWVAAQRKRNAPLVAALQGLIDADDVVLALPVRIELLSGTARRDRAALRRALGALPLVFPTEDTWRLLESWVDRAADAGYSFSVPDLLIAALASESGALVWSLDEDFVRMEKLKFVQLYG